MPTTPGMHDTQRRWPSRRGGPRRLRARQFRKISFTPLSVPAAVRGKAEDGRPQEADQLGVPATNPRSYYCRTRDIALKLSPDVVRLFLYAGDDFMPADGSSPWPRLIDKSPATPSSARSSADQLAANRPAEPVELFADRGAARREDDARHLARAARRPDRTLRRPPQEIPLPQPSRSENPRSPVARRRSFWRHHRRPKDEQEFLISSCSTS